MKVKFNPFICEKFGNKSIYYENGVIYYRDRSNKIKELPNQKRSIAILTKALESYSDETDYRLKQPENKILSQLQKSRKRSLRKGSKTEKWIRW